MAWPKGKPRKGYVPQAQPAKPSTEGRKRGWPKGRKRGPRQPKVEVSHEENKTDAARPAVVEPESALSLGRRGGKTQKTLELTLGLSPTTGPVLVSIEDQHWTSIHRGPYKLYVLRTSKHAKVGFTTEWLSGHVSSDDVDDEAASLLTDPRDSIYEVDVWSLRDHQFVWSYRAEREGAGKVA